MDANLLRSWVGLPPGPWPPADRELLGLPAGPLDPATVEAAALDRMARLRTHQLLHPELVTEGMNRVARAMMAVGSGGTARKPPPPPPPPVIDRAPAPVPEPVRVLQAEPVELPPPPPVAEVAPVPAFRRPLPVEFIRIPDDAPPPPGLALDAGEVPPHARRTAYRELAGLRGLVRAFDRLRPSLALPGEGLLTPAAVCDLLEAVEAFRVAASHPGLSRGFVRRLVPSLHAVLRHPLPLAVVRSLTRPQRVELAREWAAGRAGLLVRMEAVRAGLDRPRRRDPLVSLKRWAADELAARPEVVLVAATGLVGLAAVVRTAAR